MFHRLGNPYISDIVYLLPVRTLPSEATIFQRRDVTVVAPRDASQAVEDWRQNAIPVILLAQSKGVFMPDEEIIVGSFPKNPREEVRVSLSKFKGYDLVGVRQWFRTETDELRPSKSGITIRVDLLPDLLELIQKAQDVAVERGILELEEAE